jgi:hypothetical protein
LKIPLIFVRANNAIVFFSKDFFMAERPVAGVLGSTVLNDKTSEFVTVA